MQITRSPRPYRRAFNLYPAGRVVSERSFEKTYFPFRHRRYVYVKNLTYGRRPRKIVDISERIVPFKYVVKKKYTKSARFDFTERGRKIVLFAARQKTSPTQSGV